MTSLETYLPQIIAAQPREFAVIDLGSNSFHLLIARECNGTLQIISRLKQQVQLAAGLNGKLCLSQDAIDRGLACLSLFAERLKGFDASNVRIVATYTLRSAKNASLFIKQAKKIIPYPIEVISGQEEARLIYFGAAHTLPEKGRKLIIDIGGGSTELALGENFTPIIAQSCPIGCVNFSNRFFSDGLISKKQFNLAILTAEQCFDSLGWRYRSKDWQYTFGASGTIKAIHEVIVAMGEHDDLITLKRLHRIQRKVLSFTHVDKIELSGLSDQRKPIFLGGLAILIAIFNIFKINSLSLSFSALREGVLYEMSNDFRHDNIRQRTANNLVQQYNIDKTHAKRVLLTTQYLYKQWCQFDKELASPQLGEILFWAATLHEIGLSINYSKVQKHSAYILENSDLPGFNQEQQLLLATLVRYHRKSIKLESIPDFTFFSLKNILSLLKVLRLSIVLNNHRYDNDALSKIKLIIKGKVISLHFPANFFKENALIKMNLKEEKQYWKEVSFYKLFLNENESIKDNNIL